MPTKQPTLRVSPNTTEGAGVIEWLVRTRLRGRLQEFRLVVEEAGLVLHGKARSYHTKQVAQHEVMAATGLPIAANHIEVTTEKSPRSSPS